MKRTATLLVSVFLFSLSIQPPSYAGESYTSSGDLDYEIIKGGLIDLNGDGIPDGVDFTIKTKNAWTEVPVIDVTYSVNGNNTGQFVSFQEIEINKKFSYYQVDLSDYDLPEHFKIAVKINTSSILVQTQDIIDGGPGPNPNETILIIDYP